jgi:hypothetical protein
MGNLCSQELRFAQIVPVCPRRVRWFASCPEHVFCSLARKFITAILCFHRHSRFVPKKAISSQLSAVSLSVIGFPRALDRLLLHRLPVASLLDSPRSPNRSFVFIDIPGSFLQKKPSAVSFQLSASSTLPSAGSGWGWSTGTLARRLCWGQPSWLPEGGHKGRPYGYAVICFHRHSRFVPSNSQCSIRAAALQTGHA